jgi:Family of unknown function (DUF6174)
MKLVFALLTVVLIACTNPVQTNESVWKSKNIVNYSFTFQRSCLCPPETAELTVLTVKNGVLTSAVYANGSGSALLAYFTDVAPLEKLFRYIESAQKGGYAVTVAYDATYGFPSKIHTERSDISDANYTFTITDFKPAP